MSITLNPDQTLASAKIHDFLKDPFTKGGVFTLTGGPGTGKTFMLRDLLKEYKGDVQAATVSHAAKNILQESLGDGVKCTTISKSLGFGPKILSEGDIKFLPKGKPGEVGTLKNCKIFVIDEVSQIDDELHDMIMSQVLSYGLRVIAVGDPYQLPPVEQDIDSKFFDKIHMTLTIPMRYQGPISEIAAIYKDQIDHINVGSGFEKWALNSVTHRKNKFSGHTGYGFTNKLDEIIDLASNDIKSHPETASYARVLAFKNDSVAEVNKRVRTKLYGTDLAQFEPGEIVLCNGGYSALTAVDIFDGVEYVPGAIGRKPVLYNGQILKIATQTPVIGPYDVPCLRLEFAERKNNLSEAVYAVEDSPEASQMYNVIKETLRSEAARITDRTLRDMAWRNYYNFIQSFAYFDYAYSVNLYKAQGQTLNNVYVCEGEVMGVGPLTWKQKFQALYVAMTRAKEKLYIYNKEF
jgi:hypothetical protein